MHDLPCSSPGPGGDAPDCRRRAFLKVLPAITAGAASLAALPAEAASDNAKPHWGMLVDARQCIGCQACTVACIMENVVPEGSFRTVVSTYAVTTGEGAAAVTGTHVLPRLCNHCDNPPCVPVCPVGATFKREDGAVLVDGERCVGCAYCVQACPYDARFINHHTGKADKCTFCSHRVEAGLLPACVETCVGGARVFGDLNDPKSEIRRLMADAQDELKVLKPEQGTRPQVFYIGLDPRLQGKVDGTQTPALSGLTWQPKSHGG